MALDTSKVATPKIPLRRPLVPMRPWLVLGAIEILAFCLRWIGYGRYPHLIYDEYYYVPAADVLLGRKSPVHIPHMVPGIDPNLLSHPPLAKELIALAILWFGNHPWAWRLPGEVLGLTVPLLIYFLVRQMFSSPLVAEIAALLTACDGLMISMSRVALPDSTAFPWVVLNLLGLWVLVARLRQGKPTRFGWWALWGVSLGLGLAAKWIGAQTILASWIFLGINYRLFQRMGRRWLYYTLTVTWIPLGAYFLTYFYAFRSGFHQTWLPHNVFFAFGKLQYLMFKAMWTLTFYHPWSSNAWSWMLLPRPTAFLIIHQAGHMMRLMAFSNPILIWLGFIALVVGTWRLGFVKNQNRMAWIFLDVWWVAFYATWLLTPRSKFTYYLLSAMPAFIIAASVLFVHLWEHRNKVARIVAWVGAIAVGLSSLYLMPLWVGFPTPVGFYRNLVWPPNYKARPKPTNLAVSAYLGPTTVPLAPLYAGIATTPLPANHWTEFGNTGAHNVVLPSVAGMMSSYAQYFKAPIVVQPSVIGRHLYFGTNGDRVDSFNLTTRRMTWQDTVPNMVMTTPVGHGSQIFVGLGNNTFRSYNPVHGWIRGAGTNGIMSIDRQTGRELWFHPTVGEDMATPVIWHNVLYEVTGGGHLDALNVSTGHLMWQRMLSGFDSMSSPLVVGHELVVATNVYHSAYPATSSTVWAVNLLTHQVSWSRNLPVKSGLSDCSPATNGKLIFIAGAPRVKTTIAHQTRISNELFALDLNSGKVQWHVGLGSGIMPIDVEEEGTPMVDSGVVYIGSPSADAVVAVNAVNGQVLWRTSVGTGVTGSPLDLGKTLWVAGQNGALIQLSSTSGRRMATVSTHLGAFGPAAPLAIGNNLVAASLKGWIGIFGLIGKS